MKTGIALRVIRIAFSSSLLLASLAHAVDRPGRAIIDGKYAEITLTDLEGDGSALRGRHFVIVEGRGNEPMPLELPPASWHRAENRHYHQNVYYHLTRARRFFVEKFGLREAREDEPMIVRMNISDEFSPAGHFRAERFANHFNDSATFPASDHFLGEGVSPWGVEIWFRPPREVEARSSLQLAADQLGSREFKNAMQLGALQAQATEMGAQYTTNASFDLKHSAFQAAVAVGLWEVIPLAFAGIGKLTQGKEYIDTAVIPQIVAHEYAHSVFAPRLGLSNTPVTEGFADYFAAVMGEARYDFSLGDYSRSSLEKNARNREKYDPIHERFRYSSSDFTVSVLWMLRQELGAEVMDPIVFQSRLHLTPGANIRTDLVRALREAARELHPKARAEQLSLEMLMLLREKKDF